MDAIAFLRCEIKEGLFSDEVSVTGTDAHGADFSLFTSDRFVTVGIDGKQYLQVQCLDEDGELVLILLPSKAFENGSTITVNRTQLYRGQTAQPV